MAILVLDYFIINSEMMITAIKSVGFGFNIMNVACGGTVIAAGFLYRFSSKFINDYQLLIKSKIFPNIISFCGQYKYMPKCDNLITRDIKESAIIPYYIQETNQDYISGEYEGITISISQAHLENNDRDGPLTVFNGIIICYDVHKNFKGRAIIKKDFGKVRNLFKSKPYSFGYVKLEDPKFDEMFEVYSTDQVEKRYLLTTSFMESLLNFTKSLGGTDIKCSFYGSKLVIAISTDRFWVEPGSIYESEDFADDAKNVLRSVNTIFGIAHHLKSYQNMEMIDHWKLYQDTA